MSKPKEDKVINLKQLALVVWILDTLRNGPAKGVTFAQFAEKWESHTPSKEKLTRPRFDRHREYAFQLFGVHVGCPDRKHYRIANPEVLSLNTLANDLLASVQEYLLVDEFRDLGARLQPAQILNGRQYLTRIAHAIRHRKKLAIRYQKFTDSEPYDAVVHPYVLKAVMGRWYMLAFKESSTHSHLPAQMFALDRTFMLELLDESFEFNPSVDPNTFFDRFYGAYVDDVTYPVRDIHIACLPWVAPYLRTLPLHQSQQEISRNDLPIELHAKVEEFERSKVLPLGGPEKEASFFRFHVSASPDFIGSLWYWGPALEILDL